METLFVVACVANPLRWRSRLALARTAVADWQKEANVHITLAECAYGSRRHDLADLASARVWMGDRGPGGARSLSRHSTLGYGL